MILPAPESLLAIAGFAVATSASLGPVNLIAARFGPRRALPFVIGATCCFLALLAGPGPGLAARTGHGAAQPKSAHRIARQ